jgi:anti-sigma regulatory factor (Ser/Thr protein kinase)
VDEHVDPPEAARVASVVVPASGMAPALARHLVRAELRSHVGEPELEDLELIVTELVTNSVRHSGIEAGSPIVVRAELAENRIRLEVSDDGDGFEPGVPRPRSLADGGGGLGLVLLARFSGAWGVTMGEGACVWGEFPRGRAEERAA